MEFTARKKLLRVSPRKLRLIVDLVRNKGVDEAVNTLRFADKRWAVEVLSVLKNAINNAQQNRGVDVDRLYVKKIFVDKGPTLKRFMARARGSGAPILKRTSSMTVVLDQR